MERNSEREVICSSYTDLWVGLSHVQWVSSFGSSLCPFVPWQDNHEEDYFLYVAYSDESVYGKWAAAPQACRLDGLMEWIGGEGVAGEAGGGCMRREKRELEVNHMHNVISFHALIITIIF